MAESAAAFSTQKPDSIESAIRSFGRWLEADGRSPKTVSAYSRDISRMRRAIVRTRPGITLDGVTAAMIDDMLTSPEVQLSATGGKRSRASLHRFKAAVRSFFAWAERNGIVRDNPAASLTMRRLPRTPPRFLTEAEKQHLLKELRSKSSVAATRDRVIIELFLGTGIRLRELVDLDMAVSYTHLTLPTN